MRILFFVGHLCMCTSSLAPAVEQVRRLSPQLPFGFGLVLVILLAISLRPWVNRGSSASLVGGVFQCVLSLSIPAIVALWTLPWQSSRRTFLRGWHAMIGLLVAVASLSVVLRPYLYLALLEMPRSGRNNTAIANMSGDVTFR